MYALIMCSVDGDTYRYINDLVNAGLAFEEACEDKLYHTIILADIVDNQTFGFDVNGQFFGAEVVADHYSKNY